MDIDHIKKSHYISHALDHNELSVSFETLYRDHRVQGFLKNLGILEDFPLCQSLMSQALAKLKNAKADFVKQRAYLEEQYFECLTTNNIENKEALLQVLERLCRKDSLQSSMKLNHLQIRFVPEEGVTFDGIKTALDDKFKDTYELKTIQKESLYDLEQYFKAQDEQRGQMLHEPHARSRLYSEQIDTSSSSFQQKQYGYQKSKPPNLTTCRIHPLLE